MTQHLHDGRESCSLQCRRTLGGRNLVRVRNIVVVAIFDFMTVHGRLGRVEIVTRRVGARAKEGKGGRGRGEKRYGVFLLSPRPLPVPFDSPISSSLREVSTWRFREQISRSKKTPALLAKRAVI